MSADDLTSILGLEEKHVRALADLGITSRRQLASADAGPIVASMRRMRPAPGPEEVGRWQAAAGRRDDAPARPSWERSATFVVSFEVRQAGDALERRIAAEQTELDAEQAQEVWAEWDCSAICAWMLARLGAGDAPPVHAPTERVAARPAGRARGALRIESVRVVDGDSSVELVDGDPPDGPVPVRAASTTIAVRVGGAGAGATPFAVLRIRPAGAPGWNLGDPVVVDGDGAAELPAGDLPAGVHRAQVIVWDPGAATMASALLPPLAPAPA